MFGGLWLRFGEVVEGVVEFSANTKYLLGAINLVAEIDIINLISVTLIHISFKKEVCNLIGSLYTKLAKYTHELHLCHVAISSDIKILELRLEVDSSIIDGGSVFIKNLVNNTIILTITIQVLSPCKDSIVCSNILNLGSWCFINTLGCESKIHIITEYRIFKEFLWIISHILVSQVVEFIFSHCEVHHREDTLELILGHTTFTKFIKISEKFFDTDSFHDNGGLKTLLNIAGIIGSFDSLSLEAV